MPTQSITSQVEIPFVVRDQVLMSEGKWNGVFYSGDSIKKALASTDWNAREKRNLFVDHRDEEVAEWIGEVNNLSYRSGSLYGDLAIYDPNWATKFKYGKPKSGVSARVAGLLKEGSDKIDNFTFSNFSVVLNPAVKTAYIFNSEVNGMAVEPILLAQQETVAKTAFVEGKSLVALNTEHEDEVIAAAKKIIEKRKADGTAQMPKMPMMADEAKLSVDSETELSDAFALLEILELANKDVSAILKSAHELKDNGLGWKESILKAAKLYDKEEKRMSEERKVAEAKLAEASKTEIELSAKVKELTETVQALSEKLKEPNRTVIRKLDEKPINSVQDADRMMLAYLNEYVVEVYGDGS